MIDTARIERSVEHRPWPMPRSPWMLHQIWRDLVFAHWAVKPESLRPRVPALLELDTFDGRAWIGITPFRITDFTTRLAPTVPILPAFPELNLRTYVRVDGKPGVHFFSLDAASRAAVVGARLVFALPYRHAHMVHEPVDGRIRFRSERSGRQATFLASYAPAGTESAPAPGTLEHFLTERYALFTVIGGRLIVEAEIHHGPWMLRPAACEIERNTLAAAERVPLPAGDPVTVHFSKRQDTLIWAPRPARRHHGFARRGSGR